MTHATELGEAWRSFRGMAEPEEVRPVTAGHIHDSWLVTCGDGAPRRRYLVQRLNTGVFKDPWALMENFEAVTSHLRAQLPPDRPVLTAVASVDDPGSPIVHRGDGSVWRAFHYIEGCHSEDVVSTPEIATEVGRAFGEFQRLLAGLDPARLAVVLPNFHDLGSRMAAFDRAIDADVAGRLSGVTAEVEEVQARRADEAVATKITGLTPVRVSHNDAKVANVLVDGDGHARCVIDLDTVMAGTALWDFGDMVRSSVCRAPEDETRLDEVRVDLSLFEGLCRGYLSEASTFLVPEETSQLVAAARIIVLEQATRFLTDHLSGDTYFRIDRPLHNLERTRAQLRLLGSIESLEAEMISIVDGL